MAQQPEHTTGHHPTFKQYALIAVILFAITIVEFLLIWPRPGGGELDRGRRLVMGTTPSWPAA